MTEHQFQLFLALMTLLASIIGVPWTVWVTVSIFRQKQETAILKAELDVLNKIQGYLEKVSLV